MQYYFMHINKTAGKSIERWFDINDSPIVGAKQDACQDIIRHFDDSGFYFTVVRNPYSRIVSQFVHWRDNLKRLREGVSFKDYILNLNNPSFFVQPKHLHKYQLRFHMPCSYWIRSERFKIFKFEDIEGFVEYFVNNFDFKDNFPCLNTTTKNDIMSYFDEETIKIVNDIMLPDFQNFDYKIRESI